MLKLHVGPFEYRILRSDDALRDADHGALWGQIDYAGRRIFISHECPHESQGEVLCHEAAHAWLKNTPMPRTEEQLCNFVGLVAWGLIRDLERQGGTARLLTLGMQERVLVPVATDRDLNPSDRIDAAGCSCCVCQQSVAPGSVVRSQPTRHPKVGTPVLHLRFWCNYCEALVRWTELSTPAGLPSGVVVDPPEQVNGEEADEFCRQHPLETGILVD